MEREGKILSQEDEGIIEISLTLLAPIDQTATHCFLKLTVN